MILFVAIIGIKIYSGSSALTLLYDLFKPILPFPWLELNIINIGVFTAKHTAMQKKKLKILKKYEFLDLA